MDNGIDPTVRLIKHMDQNWPSIGVLICLLMSTSVLSFDLQPKMKSVAGRSKTDTMHCLQPLKLREKACESKARNTQAR